MKLFANVISWVFNPLVLPIIALIIVMYVPSDHGFYNTYCFYNIHPKEKLRLLYHYSIFVGIAPALSFYFLKRNKIIQSIEMETQAERSAPIAIMFLYSLLLFGLYYYRSLLVPFYPKYFVTLPLAGVIVTFIFFFLNRWKKISIHAASCGILVGFLFSYIDGHTDYQLWIIALAFIISGLVMSSRLFLKKHSLDELVIGWAIGSFITFGIGFFF
tara:strand:- start:1081 stop:1725 length:645 start_codon:yes stop_codon:yes gene_type:complete